MLLGAGMGVQNAVVRRLAIADITTTVLTLTITGIASDSALAGGDNPRLTRRVASILAMLYITFFTKIAWTWYVFIGSSIVLIVAGLASFAFPPAPKSKQNELAS